MPVEFRCSCKASYTLRDEYAGRMMNCPQCGRESLVGGSPPAIDAITISPDMLAPPPAPIAISADMMAPAPSAHDNDLEIAPRTHSQDGRRDFERGMPMAPALTLGIMVAITIMFIGQVSAGTLESRESIIQAGALTRQHVVGSAPGVAGPQVWRLVSAMFLHGSIDHLIGNAIALYILGIACEHAFGFARMGVIYLVGGLGGSLMSIALAPGPSVGASGAIFALMGAVVIFFRKHASHFVVRDNRVGWVLLGWAGWSVATGLLQPFIDNGAHIGGFLTGALLAMLLQPAILTRPHPTPAPPLQRA